jgi:hypothetical protein
MNLLMVVAASYLRYEGCADREKKTGKLPACDDSCMLDAQRGKSKTRLEVRPDILLPQA